MQQNAVHLEPKRKAFSTKTQCEMHHFAPLKAIKCHEKRETQEKKAIKRKNKPQNKAQLTIIGTNLKNNSPPQEKMHINGTKYVKAAKNRTINAQAADNQPLMNCRNSRKKTAPLAGW